MKEQFKIINYFINALYQQVERNYTNKWNDSFILVVSLKFVSLQQILYTELFTVDLLTLN